MSEAREKFFESFDFLASQGHMTICENIITHVTEIEYQNTELMSFIKLLNSGGSSKYGYEVKKKTDEFIEKYK